MYVPTHLDETQLDALFASAAESIAQVLPELPSDGNLGILDVAKAARLSPQQIRRLESYGLAKPAYVTSGAKRNRRYTAHQALVLVVAATLMHTFGLRPSQAATLLLPQGSETGAIGKSDVSFVEEAQEYTTALEHTALGVSQFRLSQEGSLVGAAADTIRRVVGARLALISVLTLLGTRELPPRCIICLRSATPDTTPSGSLQRRSDGVSESSRDMSIAVDQGISPGSTHLMTQQDDAFYAFITPQGQVFQIGPQSKLITEDRSWYHLNLAGQSTDEIFDVFLSVPQRERTLLAANDPEVKLRAGEVSTEQHTIEIAVNLCWTVVKAIPRITSWAYEEVAASRIHLEQIAVNDGLMPIVLWLYAHVLKEICPAMDQCDILAPVYDSRGKAPLLEPIASTNIDDMLRVPRTTVSSDHLLSGFALTHRQACYLGDITAETGQLNSFQAHERARAAAAIPVLLDERPMAGRAIMLDSRALACVYLNSRYHPILFTPALKRTLEVAANETAEILLQQECSTRVTVRSTIEVTRPARPLSSLILQDYIHQWVTRLAQAAPTYERALMKQQASSMDSWIPNKDGGRLVIVVIRGTVDREYQGQHEVAKWISEEASYQAADSFAQVLDGQWLSYESQDAIGWQHYDLTTSEAARLVPYTPVFSWEVPQNELGKPPIIAYLALAGLNCTSEYISRLKKLIQDRGLNGEMPARTERNEPVGRILGWVLDAKPSTIERAFLTDTSSKQVEQQVETVLAMINSCARLLPYLHQYHQEAFGEGNLRKAIATLKNARLQDETDTYVPRHLLDLYLRSHRLKEAHHLVKSYAMLEHTMPAKWFCLVGQMNYMLGDFDSALGSLNKAVELDPSRPWIYRLFAETFMAKGKFDEAVHYFGKAKEYELMRKVPDVARILNTAMLIADAQIRLGHLEAAIATYEDLMLEYPGETKDNILVQQKMSELYYRVQQASDIS
jgi:tetratricopeptide (TPR) repeat protein/DNA-binding transcriptional MerR regulator